MAQVVGGTAPDAVNRPRWFSGDESADGTGLQPGGGYPTFRGCYSAPPDSIGEVPIGVVLPGPFKVGSPAGGDILTQGEELNVDDLRVLILHARGDAQTAYANLNPYRDLMPAAFAGHLQLFSGANVLQAMTTAGKPIRVDWAGTKYIGFEFTVRVIRIVARTYSV